MSKKKKKVMGFGTFDGLHPGHLSFLRQLKNLGKKLVVVVARDVNVEKIKGRRSKWNEEKRLKAIQSAQVAHEVILGNEKDFYQCIRDHQPDVIGLGYDQKADLKHLQLEFPQIRFVRLEAFEPGKYKSSLLNL